MNSLEQIVANNLTELRKEKKWTQAELAEKINYSDKSVSKWERGEALPDLKVLKQMADLFGVRIDFFITENAASEKEKFTLPKGGTGFRVVVALLAACIVWLIAVVVFVSFSIKAKWLWMVFIWAIPASTGLMTEMFRHWGFRITSLVFRSIASWTLLAAVFLQLLVSRGLNAWMIFLVGIPLQAVLILWTTLRPTKR